MFADMPLDNRTVDNLQRRRLVWLPQAVLKRRRGQNDLIFRSGWLFCNIELKIRQYA
jgi:hypothetical protein